MHRLDFLSWIWEGTDGVHRRQLKTMMQNWTLQVLGHSHGRMLSRSSQRPFSMLFLLRWVCSMQSKWLACAIVFKGATVYLWHSLELIKNYGGDQLLMLMRPCKVLLLSVWDVLWAWWEIEFDIPKWKRWRMWWDPSHAISMAWWEIELLPCFLSWCKYASVLPLL